VNINRLNYSSINFMENRKYLLKGGNKMFVLIVTIKSKEGREKELEALLAGMIPDVQNEEGTIAYSLHRSQNEQGKFLFYEKYRTKEDFEYHSSTPYFKVFAGKVNDLVEGEMNVEFYEEITAIV
jgi:quinol monooxygenase YgiN